MPWAKLNPMKPNLYADSFQRMSQLCFKSLCVRQLFGTQNTFFFSLLLKQYKKVLAVFPGQLTNLFNPKCTLSFNCMVQFHFINFFFCFCGKIHPKSVGKE